MGARQQQYYGRRQSGMGLVELIVSIAIGIMVLGGVVQVMSTTVISSRNTAAMNRMQENIRFVASKMARDASQAGSFGCFSMPYYESQGYTSTVGDILTTENTTSATTLNRYDTERLITGFNDTGLNNSDTVMFRYASSAGGIPFESYKEFDINSATPTGDQITLDLTNSFDKQKYADIDQYDVVLAASCSGAIYFMVTNDPTDTPSDSEVIELSTGVTAPSDHVNAGQGNRAVTTGHQVGGVTVLGSRLVDENNVNDLEDDVEIGSWDGSYGVGTRPYLYSTSHSNAVIYQIETSMAAAALGESCDVDNPQNCALTRDGIELVEGVEDLQIEYGWNDGGDEDGELFFGDASELTNDQWNYVDRIRVSLTFNSIESVAAGGDDNLGRREFTTTIALKNQIRD